MTTRSQTIAGSVLKDLVGLSDDQIKEMENDYGLKTLQDLRLLDSESIEEILGSEKRTFLIRRKLNAVVKFLSEGGNLIASTTMSDVMRTNPTLRFAAAGSQPSSASSSNVSAPIKLNTSDFPKFSGDVSEQETYKELAESAIGQTTFKFLLTRDATTPEEKDRDEELYNVFKTSFHGGTAYHLIQEALKDQNGNNINPSGRKVWLDFQSWCLSGGRKVALVQNVKDRLRALKLDGDEVDGLAYVSKFILENNKLENMGAPIDDHENLTSFCDNIMDPDFETVQQILKNILLKAARDKSKLNPREFYDMVEDRQRTLNKRSEFQMEAKSRRAAYERPQDGGHHKPSSNGNSTDVTLPAPLFRSLSTNQKRAFLRWKRAITAGKSVKDAELTAILEQQGSTDKKEKGSGKGKRKAGAIKICRKGNIEKEAEAKIQILSDPENSESDSDTENVQTQSKKKKSRTNKIVRRDKTKPTNKNSFDYSTILDSGTEWTVIGGPAWQPVKMYKNSLNISAVDNDMTTITMNLCDAVTTVQTQEGKSALIGVKRSGYSTSLTDDEAIINTHLMREAGWNVDCVAKRHGGTQQFTLPTCEKISTEYNANCYKMFVFCRYPTPEEIRTLPINWIDCHIDDLEIEKGTRPARRDKIDRINSKPIAANPHMDDELVDKEFPLNNENNLKNKSFTNVSEQQSSHVENEIVEIDNKREESGAKINWQHTLGFCTEEALKKTLQNTTQYYPTYADSEVREYPRQHRQKRLHALHLRRLPGRTCADTFFSSVKSVRGYTCVQLFVVVFSDYLWVKLLRRESQVPGAYSDFCTKVGAPNELLTDNSKVQAGEKFQEINKRNFTDHSFTTPHCQNQNLSERKIQDVKHSAIILLYRSGAPLNFWCYAVEFMVNCLNHVSKQKLQWKTPQGVMDNNTVDISVFRYEFWQPIDYYDPFAKFPACKWKAGRMLGQALDHGDPFTYRVWVQPENGGDNLKGRELIRNVIRPRSSDKVNSKPLAEYENWEFEINRNRVDGADKRTKSKKRSHLEITPTDVANTGANKNAIKKVRFEDTSNLNSKNSEELTNDELGEQIVTTSTQIINNEEMGQEELNAILDDRFDSHEYENISDPDPINDEFNAEARQSREKSYLVAIDGFRWKLGQLQLRLHMSTGESQWVAFRDAQLDYPRQTATYIVNHYKTRRKDSGKDRVLSWAKKAIRDLNRAVRRIARLYDMYLDDDDKIRLVRRVIRKQAKKKKKKFPRPKRFKYGIQVPNNVEEAIAFDEQNGNTFWQDAIKLEISALSSLNCWEFKPEGDIPGDDYQKTTLHMVFDVKQDLRRKARLVAGGHLVELLDNDVYASNVKGISVKLLHVIAHANDLNALCGDVGNAFPNAYTEEKVYAIAGLEFGREKKGMIVVIKKALYGLATSCAQFYRHLSDTLRSIGFSPTRFDRDVWFRLSEDKTYYEYLCTHVDDFCIFAKDPNKIMKLMQEVYQIKSIGPPDYYLGNDFKKDSKGRWNMGCKKYIVESLVRIEKFFGNISKNDIPMSAGDHPEMDDSELLDDDNHQKYQMLIGMLNWVVTLGRLDIAYAVSSLSRFVACPRKGHLKRALHVFGYLKRRPNRRIRIDSRNPIIIKNGAEDQFENDISAGMKEHYPDAVEVIDKAIPEPLLDELAITAFVDSDHAHDKVTRRSITGLLIFVGRTPVQYMSKRQGAIETSTYGAEFMAMKTAVEEVMSVRYMLRCLGVKVSKATHVLGDNRSVIMNATLKSSLLKKKHVSISYHMAREAAAAKIIHPIKTRGENNFADVLTKALGRNSFKGLVNGILT